jgi:RNA polymerase sigma-70 factor (ECF subfamily)
MMGPVEPAYSRPARTHWNDGTLNDQPSSLVADATSPTAAGRDSELERLAQAMAAGNSDALGEIYDLTVGKVHALVRAIVRDSHDAEEVTCDVYTKAWQSAASYDHTRSSFMTWLMMLARSRCLDLLRQRKVRERVFTSDESAAENAVSGEVDAVDLLQRLQAGSAMRMALEGLAPVRRQILSLAFFQDLSQPEIAAALGLPLGTVKSHMRRALMALREVVEP